MTHLIEIASSGGDWISHSVAICIRHIMGMSNTLSCVGKMGEALYRVQSCKRKCNVIGVR